MDRFIKTLKKINTSLKSIAEELNQSKARSSEIVNSELRLAYPEIKDKKTTKEFIKKIWESLLVRASRKVSRTWISLFTEMDKLLKVIYSNKLTLRSFLSELRKPLTDFKKWDKSIYDESIVKMGMTIDESKEISRQYKAEVQSRNINRGDKPPIYIEDIFELLDKLIISQNAYELALGIELATGSRGIEVFKISEYEEIIDHPEQISVKGVAKDKSGNNLENVVLTRNLVHLNSKQVIDAVAKIRSLVNVDGTNQKISQRTNKHLNAKSKELILPLIEKNASEDERKTEEYKNYINAFTSHKTRYIYGNASYLIYAKQKNIPIETYIQGQLGHLSGDSTKSYLGVNIKFRHKLIKDISPEIKEYIDTVDKKINKLEKDINVRCDPATNNLGIDYKIFQNSFSRRETQESKIDKIIDAIKAIKSKVNAKMPRQSELGTTLGFGAKIMTLAYAEARKQGLINGFNIR